MYNTLPETNMKIPTKKYPKMMDFKVKGDSFLNIDISGMYVKFQGCNSQFSRDPCILIEGRVFMWWVLSRVAQGNGQRHRKLRRRGLSQLRVLPFVSCW